MKTCEKCGRRYQQTSNVQKRCSGCSVFTCPQCGKKFRSKERKSNQKFCSLKCNALAHIKTLHEHRGVKPRTYHLTHRSKHGSAEERDWRTRVFQRDDYTCQHCGIRGGRLQAHHIKPYAAYLDLRFDIDNGITLCVACHEKTDSFGWANYWKHFRSKRLDRELAQGDLFVKRDTANRETEVRS